MHLFFYWNQMHVLIFLLCLIPSVTQCSEQEAQKVLKRPAEDLPEIASRRRIELTDEIKMTLIRFLLSKDFDKFFLLADSFEPGKRRLIYNIPISPAGTLGDAQDAKAIRALHIAAQSANCNVINKLIEGGVAVDIPDNVAATPLHLAARSNHVAALRCLQKWGATVDAHDEHHSTPLHYAAFWGCKEAVVCLLDMGADIKAKDDQGRTPLEASMSDGNRPKVWFRSCTRTIPLLIGRGAHVFAKIAPWQTSENVNELFAAHYIRLMYIKFGAIFKTEGGRTLLLDAAKSGFKEIVEDLLQNSYVDVNNRDDDENTALHLAAIEGHVDVVKLLLAHPGIKGLLFNGKGNTAFHEAADHGKADVVAAFLAAAFDPLKLNGNYVTVKDIGKRFPEVKKQMKQKVACQKVMPMEIEQVSVPELCPANALELSQELAAQLSSIKELSRTSSVSDAGNSSKEAFSRSLIYLLDCKSPNTKIYDERTLLLEAAAAGFLEIVAELVDNVSAIDVNAADAQGNTALHLAATAGRRDVVRFLLSKSGIKKDALNKNGRTAFYEAASQGKDYIVTLFLAWGCDPELPQKHQIPETIVAEKLTAVQLEFDIYRKLHHGLEDVRKRIPLDIYRLLIPFAQNVLRREQQPQPQFTPAGGLKLKFKFGRNTNGAFF